MLKINKILFATDFSVGAEWAGAYARAFARATGAELHVLFADVLHSDASVSEETWRGEAAQGRLRSETKKANEREKDFPPVTTIEVVRRNFSPAPAILEYADEEAIDLIVTGTHGRRGVRRLVMGSVAEEVVRVAQCPVLTVREREGRAPTSVTVGPIITPIDFSVYATNALTFAGELARLFHTELALLHVVEETLHPAFYGLTVQSIYDVHPDIEEKAEMQMARLLKSAVGDDVAATINAVPGKAVIEIADAAAERPGSLVVMGTHGLAGLDRFLMGSTTERVVRNCAAPVLSVKSFGKSLTNSAEQVSSEALLTPETR